MQVSIDRKGKKFWFTDRAKQLKQRGGGSCYVSAPECIWRKCFQPHDCGYHNSAGGWVVRGWCALNFNKGCPEVREYVKCCDAPDYKGAINQVRASCKSCGARPPMAVRKAIIEMVAREKGEVTVE